MCYKGIEPLLSEPQSDVITIRPATQVPYWNRTNLNSFADCCLTT